MPMKQLPAKTKTAVTMFVLKFILCKRKVQKKKKELKESKRNNSEKSMKDLQVAQQKK